jgi:hypothetical protein
MIKVILGAGNGDDLKLLHAWECVQSKIARHRLKKRAEIIYNRLKRINHDHDRG